MSSAVDRILLGVAPWPLISSLSPRFAHLFPRRAVIAAAVLLFYCIAVLLVVLTVPRLLVLWAVAVTGATAAILWRTRAGSGRSQRLPPGPLPLVPAVGFVTDPEFVARHIARYGSVSKTLIPTMAQPVVLVSGLKRGADVLRDNDERLQWVGMSFDSHIPAGFIRSMNPTDHRHYRRLLRSAFTDAVIKACEPEFALAGHSMLRRMTETARGRAVDPRLWLSRYAVAALARFELGIMPGADLDLIEDLYTEPGPLDGLWSAKDGDVRSTVASVGEILDRRVAEFVETLAQGGEPPACVLGEIVRELPDSLTDPNVRLNLIFLLATGARDVGSLLHWIVKMLADNPSWIEKGQDANAPADLPERVVFETLRLAQSEVLMRKVTATLSIDGFVVPADWYLRICVKESHGDPAVFPNPGSFDPDRFIGMRYGRDAYAPFGMRQHTCIGANTTVAIAAALIRELLREYDWTIIRDGTPEFDGFHWRPSRRFRIGIAYRAAGSLAASHLIAP